MKTLYLSQACFPLGMEILFLHTSGGENAPFMIFLWNTQYQFKIQSYQKLVIFICIHACMHIFRYEISLYLGFLVSP